MTDENTIIIIPADAFQNWKNASASHMGSTTETGRMRTKRVLKGHSQVWAMKLLYSTWWMQCPLPRYGIIKERTTVFIQIMIYNSAWWSKLALCSSVGRAVDCSSLHKSIGHWFDSGRREFLPNFSLTELVLFHRRFYTMDTGRAERCAHFSVCEIWDLIWVYRNPKDTVLPQPPLLP